MEQPKWKLIKTAWPIIKANIYWVLPSGLHILIHLIFQPSCEHLLSQLSILSALCKFIHLISGITKIQDQVVNPNFCFPIVMPHCISSKEYDISGMISSKNADIMYADTMFMKNCNINYTRDSKRNIAGSTKSFYILKWYSVS